MTGAMLPGFTPYPGFDPLECDPRVSLSESNPCRPGTHDLTNDAGRNVTEPAGDGAGRINIVHEGKAT